MVDWKEYNEDSQKRWEENSRFWDDYMGDENNAFHREIIRPYTEKLLKITPEEKVLDIACGNGNFSKRLAELGAEVVAFDFSFTMIERAQKRWANYLEKITFFQLDASDYHALISLGQGSFHKAVSNMALMDMATLEPLFQGVHYLLQDQGIFVFSIIHPCFQAPGMKKIVEEEVMENQINTKRSIQISRYIRPETYKGVAIKNQPVASRYFHRSLSDLFQVCFAHGFVLNGIAEPTFDKKNSSGFFQWIDIPPALILRLQKI